MNGFVNMDVNSTKCKHNDHNDANIVTLVRLLKHNSNRREEILFICYSLSYLSSLIPLGGEKLSKASYLLFLLRLAAVMQL